MVLLHQAVKRGFVAVEQPLDQRCIVGVRRRAVSALTRAIGPLAVPADAEVIDTTGMTEAQVVEHMVGRIRGGRVTP